MVYATFDDYVSFYRQYEATEQTNEIPGDSHINREFVEFHLPLTESKINTIIGKRYHTPVTPTPPILQLATLVIVWWQQELLGEVRQTVERHYEEMIALLQEIATGDKPLLGADGKPILPLPSNPAETSTKSVFASGDRGLVGGLSGYNLALTLGTIGTLGIGRWQAYKTEADVISAYPDIYRQYLNFSPSIPYRPWDMTATNRKTLPNPDRVTEADSIEDLYRQIADLQSELGRLQTSLARIVETQTPGYIPTLDLDLVGKKWVEDQIDRIPLPIVTGFLTQTEADSRYAQTSAIPDVTGFLTQTTADSRYAQASALSGYYTKTEADSRYAQTSAIPDVTGFLTQTTADSRYAQTSAIPDVTGFLTQTEADSRYAQTSALSGYYTKTEADSRYAQTSAIPDVTGFATKIELSADLETKQDASAVLTTLVDHYPATHALDVFGHTEGGTAGYIALEPAIRHLLGTQATTGLFCSKIRTIAVDSVLVRADSGYLLDCTADLNVIVPTDTNPQSDIMTAQEIGIFASGGTVTVKVSGAALVNDAAVDITIPRYSAKVLKKFGPNKYYLI